MSKKIETKKETSLLLQKQKEKEQEAILSQSAIVQILCPVIGINKDGGQYLPSRPPIPKIILAQ